MKAKHPTTVGELARMVIAEGPVDEFEFAATVRVMASEGAISLKDPSNEITSALDYLFAPVFSGWLWATLGFATVAIACNTLIPDVFPVNVIRWVLGSIFVLYLPGYILVQFLFMGRLGFDPTVRFALCIGLSLVTVSIIGLLLNFTPLGLRFAPVTISLGVFTLVMTVAAGIRKYRHIGE